MASCNNDAWLHGLHLHGVRVGLYAPIRVLLCCVICFRIGETRGAVMDRGFHVPLRVGHSSAISVFTTRVHPFAPDFGHGLAPLCLLISGYPLDRSC